MNRGSAQQSRTPVMGNGSSFKGTTELGRSIRPGDHHELDTEKEPSSLLPVPWKSIETPIAPNAAHSIYTSYTSCSSTTKIRS